MCFGGAGQRLLGVMLRSHAHALACLTPQVDAIVEEHAEKYKQCGMQCIRSVADFYRRDMELFGFSLPEDFKM